MTQEQKQIAIAKACGWKGISLAHLYGYAPWRAIPYEICVANCPVSNFESIPIDPLPDYFNDLNAIHGAEKILFPTHEAEWYHKLHTICRDSWRIALTATATQRAEAFGLTLGLWK